MSEQAQEIARKIVSGWTCTIPLDSQLTAVHIADLMERVAAYIQPYLTEAKDDALLDDVDAILPLVKDLTAYQANVFLILNDGRAGLRFRDNAALALIGKHRQLIEDRERRRFEPLATAIVIVEIESLAGHVADISEDTARLDWLESFIQTGVVEAGFEMEGGVHLTLSKLGEPEPTAYREKNSLREATDEAMREGI